MPIEPTSLDILKKIQEILNIKSFNQQDGNPAAIESGFIAPEGFAAFEENDLSDREAALGACLWGLLWKEIGIPRTDRLVEQILVYIKNQRTGRTDQIKFFDLQE